MKRFDFLTVVRESLSRWMRKALLIADVHLVLFIVSFFGLRIWGSSALALLVFLGAGTVLNCMIFRIRGTFPQAEGVTGTWCFFMDCALLGDLLLILLFRRILIASPAVFTAVLLPFPLTAAVLAFTARKSKNNDWKTLLLFPVGVLLIFSGAMLIFQQAGARLIR